MTETKTILLIGRSGRGKSTLANVLSETNKFKESSGSVSETKKIQFEEFVDKDNNLNYSVIDTPGIGDTKMSDSEVLDIIAEAVYRAKDGISQVFFVIDGRFDQYEMATYDLLRTIIFDDSITNHTTIIRTRFEEFANKIECENNLKKMIEEAEKKKNNQEREINEKKGTMKNLSFDSEQCQKLSAEVERLEKETKVTNLAEIIKSCEEKVVYVDNPSIEIAGAKDLQINRHKRKRFRSRKVLLEHLSKSCLKTYNPPNLKKLSLEIAEDYFQYLKKKEELQRELDSLKVEEKFKENNKQVSQIKFDENKIELISEKKEPKAEEQNNIKIIKIQKVIAQLQDKRERLMKEIAEKEKIIRQKVLKHIFNNYQEINQELGGDIFLNNVIGDHNWLEINQEFTDRGLVIKWLGQGFNYEQVQNWVIALGSNFDPKNDAGFCAWLRDNKQLTVDKIKVNHSESIEQLRNEYASWLAKTNEMLELHTQKLKEEDWASVHEDFVKEDIWDKTYRQYWEEINLTFRDTQSWIRVNWEPDDYQEISQWKNYGFTPHQAQEWLNIGLNKQEYELAFYFRDKSYDYLTVKDNLIQLREEYNNWLEKSKDAQTYLDQNYPQHQRKDIAKLDIREKNLTNSLNLNDFVNCEELNCSNNNLISLTISNCPKLKIIDCSNNQLVALDISNQLGLTKLECWNNKPLTALIITNKPQLTYLDCYSCNLTTLQLDNNPKLEKLACSDNQLTNLNFLNSCREGLTSLSIWGNKLTGSLTPFSQLLNCEKLYLNDNSLTGSLTPLGNLRKLKTLDINNTNLDSGLEYLPESLEKFYCDRTKLVAELEPYGKPDVYNFLNLLRTWKQVKFIRQQNVEQITKIQVVPK